MSRRPLIALLVAGVLAAVVADIHLWMGGSPAPPASDGDWESASEGAPEALPELEWGDVYAYLGRLPELDPERSPFFTRDETLYLARGTNSVGLAGQGAAMRLDGTLYSASRRVAWIDGRPHSEGDPVADYRVAEIRTGAVMLVRGEQTLRLEVGREAFPAPADEKEQGGAE